MDNFKDYKIRITDIPLPDHCSAVKFLAVDKEEVKTWAQEHAQKGWMIDQGRELLTLTFTHKEGDTAIFPFTYQWDGEKIVKQYHEENHARDE